MLRLIDCTISSVAIDVLKFQMEEKQSGRSPKVVALVSATSFSSNIIELL